MPTDEDVLRTPLQYLKGVGPRRAADLQRVGLLTVEDLLHRFPIRYEDRSRLQAISRLQPGRPASISGEILTSGVRPTRRFKIFEAVVRDQSGLVVAAWLNQPFLRDVLRRGDRVVLFGPVEIWQGRLQLTNPDYEIVDADEWDTIHTGRIVPVYERAGAVTPKMERRLVYEAVQRLPDTLPDPLPEALRRRRGLPARRDAIAKAHFPDPATPLDELNRFRTPAQVRLIFEEFFLFQAGLLLRRRLGRAERKPHRIDINEQIRAASRAVLPFKLTAGQKQALKEIVEDMRRPQPMNRLLQGDVGAGKTIVALLAALVAMENGLQVAFMAPTEILAGQHYLTIRRLLEASRFRVRLFTGTTGGAARRDLLAELASGATHLAIGTHALVQEGVSFHALGLVVIDEQHRFGVLQRAMLRAKGLHPDVLVMTATPIPRTLALTTYGDLDVTVIRDAPPGRLPIKTIVRPDSARDKVHEFVRRQLDAGRQAYVIYPLVEESAKIDLRAATEMADHLQQEVFPQDRVALLHGRMKEEARDRVMRAFAAGDIDVLVATTVVEVGVDVPNASVMVIEHAERFGLAQLHQLRGRVGRWRHQSYCVLLHPPYLSDQARARLKAIEETTDGFVIAERDLQLRGPGDFFGTRQSGMPTFRAGDIVRDHTLMEDARREASASLERGPAATALAAWVQRNWERHFGLVGVG